MTSYDVASSGLTCILSSSVSSPSSMLKYTQAPGAVVSRFGSSETGSVGRTIVSVPPRFWASTEGTSIAARPSTESPTSSREVRMGSAPFEQIVGGRDGRVEGVHRAVALAYQRGARELVLVAVGVQPRQLPRALKARERRYRQREVVGEPIAAR